MTNTNTNPTRENIRKKLLKISKEIFCFLETPHSSFDLENIVKNTEAEISVLLIEISNLRDAEKKAKIQHVKNK